MTAIDQRLSSAYSLGDSSRTYDAQSRGIAITTCGLVQRRPKQNVIGEIRTEIVTEGFKITDKVKHRRIQPRPRATLGTEILEVMDLDNGTPRFLLDCPIPKGVLGPTPARCVDRALEQSFQPSASASLYPLTHQSRAPERIRTRTQPIFPQPEPAPPVPPTPKPAPGLDHRPLNPEISRKPWRHLGLDLSF